MDYSYNFTNKKNSHLKLNTPSILRVELITNADVNQNYGHTQNELLHISFILVNIPFI